MTKALRVALWVLAVVAMVATVGTAFAQPKQIRVGGNIQQINLVKKVAPMYPVAMKAQGLEAVVLLNVVISGEGVPTSISVQDTTVPREFTDAAIEAVKEWQYKPTLLNGEPVEVVTTVQINFPWPGKDRRSKNFGQSRSADSAAEAPEESGETQATQQECSGLGTERGIGIALSDGVELFVGEELGEVLSVNDVGGTSGAGESGCRKQE